MESREHCTSIVFLSFSPASVLPACSPLVFFHTAKPQRETGHLDLLDLVGVRATDVKVADREHRVGPRVGRAAHRAIIEARRLRRDKASAPSWSAEIHKVTDVIGKRGSVAEKYKINAKGFGDKTFTRIMIYRRW